MGNTCYVLLMHKQIGIQNKSVRESTLIVDLLYGLRPVDYHLFDFGKINI